MSDFIPEYYQNLTEGSGEKKSPNQKAESPRPSRQGEGGDREPSEPTIYRADAFRLLRPEGEWQDGSIYTFTWPTIDGVPHNITVDVDDDIEADSVCDSAAQELALGSIFRPRKQRRQ